MTIRKFNVEDNVNLISTFSYLCDTKLFASQEKNLVTISVKVRRVWNQCAFLNIVFIGTILLFVAINEVKIVIFFFVSLRYIDDSVLEPMYF